MILENMSTTRAILFFRSCLQTLVRGWLFSKSICLPLSAEPRIIYRFFGPGQQKISFLLACCLHLLLRVNLSIEPMISGAMTLIWGCWLRSVEPRILYRFFSARQKQIKKLFFHQALSVAARLRWEKPHNKWVARFNTALVKRPRAVRPKRESDWSSSLFYTGFWLPA